MHKLLVVVFPLVLFGCMFERDRGPDRWGWYRPVDSTIHHEHEHEHEHWHGKHGEAGRDCPRDGSVPDEEDASLATNEVTPVDAGKPPCKSNDDCEAMSYCQVDAGDCLPGTPCQDESACDPGFNCDSDKGLCLPAAMERCSEMKDEAACTARTDCMTTYAGVNCTCGPDCTCMGGEPNCVCERFEYFVCADVLK